MQKQKINNPCHIYLVRHGETEWNKQKILQGALDSPLTEAGIEQAVQRSADLRNITFADVFSSDLFRAQRTAEILQADRKLAVTTTALLRELSFGSYDGKPVTTYRHELREQLEEMEKLSEEQLFNHKLLPDIESSAEAAQRMLTFLRETAVAYPNQNVLAVAHGGLIRVLLIKLGFGSSKELDHSAVGNLGYVVIASDGIEFEIVTTVGITKNIL